MLCPRCGKTRIRPSLQSGMIDSLLRLMLLAPFRCRACRARFYRFALSGTKIHLRNTSYYVG
jgi:hypothetical protein